MNGEDSMDTRPVDTASEAYASPPRRRGASGLLTLIALLGGLGGGAWMMREYGPKQVVEVERKVEIPVATPVAPTSPATVATQGEQSAPFAYPERLAEIEQRIAQINVQAQAAGGNAARAEDLLVAFSARRAVERGMAMGYLESELQRRFGRTMPKAVASVIEASRNPVTADKLAEQLEALSPHLRVDQGSGDFWSRARYELSNLFVVRPEKTVRIDPSQRLSRAQRALDMGRVDRAITEVEALPGADKAGSWLIAARRYVQAQRALDLLEYAAIQGDASAPRDISAAAPAATAATPQPGSPSTQPNQP